MIDFNVLFLCAGYGTRLNRDLDEAGSGSKYYSMLKGLPKALLPVNGPVLLDHWLDSCLLEHISKDRIHLVCNHHFYPAFKQWATKRDIQNVLDDGTTSNITRLGAVRDILVAVEHFNLFSKPLLVIAGDTLFMRDFSFKSFIDSTVASQSLVTSYTVAHDQDTLKTGIIELDDSRRVVGFLEKPGPSETKSRCACPCFYWLDPIGLDLLKEFVAVHRNAPLAEIDASGKFISWLISKHAVYAYAISGRLDIGGLSSYIDAEQYMQS